MQSNPLGFSRDVLDYGVACPQVILQPLQKFFSRHRPGSLSFWVRGSKILTRWWFQICFLFSPLFAGRWTHFDVHIFQLGWNHQLVRSWASRSPCYCRGRAFWWFRNGFSDWTFQKRMGWISSLHRWRLRSRLILRLCIMYKHCISTIAQNGSVETFTHHFPFALCRIPGKSNPLANFFPNPWERTPTENSWNLESHWRNIQENTSFFKGTFFLCRDCRSYWHEF